MEHRDVALIFAGEAFHRLRPCEIYLVAFQPTKGRLALQEDWPGSLGNTVTNLEEGPAYWSRSTAGTRAANPSLKML